MPFNKTSLKFDVLEKYLVENYPNDVLMPVRRGSKAPAFPHSGGRWSFESWKQVKNDCSWSDACVVLNRLCVVDVDSEEANNKLLARFPSALANAPVEKTLRGFHYWFIRPDFADDLGYFDGAAQREKGIDFKSVYSNGTGGIIVVSPSDGRTWVTGRELWETPPFHMPFELLDAVAAPKVPLASCVMRCVDGELVEARRSRFVTISSYFEPVLSGEFSADGFPVPLLSSVLRDLIALVDQRRLPESIGNTSPEDVDKWIAEIATAGDLIGLPRVSLESAINNEVVLVDIWARKVLPVQTRVCREEVESFLLTRDAVLVRVPDSLVLEHLPRTIIDTWGLFSDDDSVDEPVDDSVLSISSPPGPRFGKSLPSEVARMMEKHSDTLVAAGGFVAGAVLDHAAPGSDIDLFIHSCTTVEADEILAEFMLMTGSTFVCATMNAVTLAMERPGGGAPLAVQLIRSINTCRAEILANFDFSPCKVLARSVGEGNFVVECLPSFIGSARNMAFVVDFVKWNSASCFRVLKYCAKGFDVILPGVTSETREKPPLPTTTWDASVLLKAHEHILTSRYYHGYYHPKPLTISDVCKAFKSFKDATQSGYDEIIWTGRLEHALKEMDSNDGGRGRPEAAHERSALVPRLGEWITPGSMMRVKPSRHGRIMSRIEIDVKKYRQNFSFL